MGKNIVIFGAGPHAHCVIDAINSSREFHIVGIIDSFSVIGSNVLGYTVIGRQQDISILSQNYNIDCGVIAIGDNYSRYLVAEEIKNVMPTFEFANVIHPSVIMSKTTKLGFGNIILAGSILSVGAVMGNHCVINTGSHLEHYSIMKDFSSISAGVILGGFVILNEFTAIALGVTIFDRVTIGSNTVIGSGALVTKDIPANVLAYGRPAEVIRTRKLGERFLK